MRDLNKIIADIYRSADSDSDALLLSAEKELQKAYTVALREIRRDLAEIYAKFGANVSFVDMAKYDRLTKLEKLIASRINVLRQQSQKITRAAIMDEFERNYYYTGFATEKALQVKTGWTVLSDETVKAAVLNPMDRLTWTSRNSEAHNQMMRRLRQTLTTALIQGYGFRTLTGEVKRITERTAYQAARIIRTESHRAQSAGRLAGMGRSFDVAERVGIKARKKWISTLDGRTRHNHGEADGMLADEEGIFTLPNGVTGQAPGLTGVAAEDIHCRCGVIMYFEDIPQNLRRAGDEVIPYETYGEWFGERIAA